jgi:dihydropteroate synthase
VSNAVPQSFRPELCLRIRGRQIHLGVRTQIMGILNVTPDSFSDGGRHFTPDSAIRRGLEMVREGADWIDVGGESTRPGASAVDEAEECRRVLPVVEALSKACEAVISVDTQKVGVARQALERGASIINDVGAGLERSAMWRLVAETGAGYVAMHMQGTPSTMQINPSYGEACGDVYRFFEDRIEAMLEMGMNPDQIVLDVGIGFGKALEHNLRLLGGLRIFKHFRRPILVGVSRKSFIGALTEAGVGDRLPGSLAAASWAVMAGAHILRVHDVAESVQAVRVVDAIALHAG